MNIEIIIQIFKKYIICVPIDLQQIWIQFWSAGGLGIMPAPKKLSIWQVQFLTYSAQVKDAKCFIEVTFKYFYVKPLTSDAVIPKRHEPKLYEAGGSVNGLFLIIYD